ncbi:hypothetical protein SGLAM104S_01696 [Streptomyces glaucescens]
MPSTRSRSSSAARPVSSIAPSARSVNTGSPAARAAPACTTATVSACPMESCSSRAIRVRSSNRSVRSSRAASRSAADGPSSLRASTVISSPSPTTAAAMTIRGRGARKAYPQCGSAIRRTGLSYCSRPSDASARSTATMGIQTVRKMVSAPSSMRASSHTTVRSRSPQVADGAVEMPESDSSGVSMNRAWSPSPRRTAGISPTGIITRAGTHGRAMSMNNHTLTSSTGTHRCSRRVYVVPRSSGRRKRTIGSSCQPPPTTGLPRARETISTRRGGDAPATDTSLRP